MNDSIILVRDLMTVGVATCAPDTPLAEVVRFLLDKDQEAVVVSRDDKHALGIVTQDELVRAYGREDLQALKAEDVMRIDIPQLPPDIPLAAAAQVMRDQRVRAVFMMHHAGGVVYPAAVLTYRHLLRHMGAQENENLRDLGIYAERKTPIETFLERREAARRAAGLKPDEK
jgi:predicted transcriptional regulator